MRTHILSYNPMKKMLMVALCGTLALFLFGCGGGASGGSDGSTSDAPQQEEQKKPLDLSGEWKQVNSKSEDSYQEATIQDNVIEINWVSDGGDTKSLYWSGTYEAPTEATESYTWDSVNDTSKTANALLASGDETKTFTYENGVLSYEASALGTTTTVKMERQ